MFSKDLDKITEIKDTIKNEFTEIQMNGMRKDLASIRSKLIDIMENDMFSLGYGMGDVLYFGYTQEELGEMVKVKNKLENSLLELLAVIEITLNEKTVGTKNNV